MRNVANIPGLWGPELYLLIRGSKLSLEAQLPIYWVPVLKSLCKFILSITQGPTIWVPGASRVCVIPREMHLDGEPNLLGSLVFVVLQVCQVNLHGDVQAQGKRHCEKYGPYVDHKNYKSVFKKVLVLLFLQRVHLKIRTPAHFRRLSHNASSNRSTPPKRCPRSSRANHTLLPARQGHCCENMPCATVYKYIERKREREREREREKERERERERERETQRERERERQREREREREIQREREREREICVYVYMYIYVYMCICIYEQMYIYTTNPKP